MKNVININNNIVHKTNTRSKLHYLTERDTLLILQNNYVDYFSVNYYPFPKIVSYNNDKLILTLSFCGDSLDNLSVINVDNKELYIKNILLNIKNNNINYTDLRESNICIMDNKIYLIDFENVVLNEQFNYISNYHHFNFITDKKTGETSLTG